MNDKGTGFFDRMKQKLESGIDQERGTMFAEASSNLYTQLKQLVVSDKALIKLLFVCCLPTDQSKRPPPKKFYCFLETKSFIF